MLLPIPRVDKAEGDADAAFRINGEAVGYLSRAVAASGARSVHVSTDFVFDGEAGRPYVRRDGAARRLWRRSCSASSRRVTGR